MCIIMYVFQVFGLSDKYQVKIRDFSVKGKGGVYCVVYVFVFREKSNPAGDY